MSDTQPGPVASSGSGAPPAPSAQPGPVAFPGQVAQPLPVVQPEPVACTLGSGDLGSRMARWDAVTARAAGEHSVTQHGVRLTFTAGPGVASELRDLAALEADCCAFATWTVHEHGGQVLVDVTGDTPEAVAAVREMFAALSG